MANALAQSASPYLLQHQDNPVDWREWSPATLALAKEQDRPILLSVGYAACHWCHVMAHESFENDEIAALMNREFVNIKVDREERPDIDAIYQQALALMGQQGGWPLTMFLTPDGEPFWGGTYFPPEPRYGRPSFPQVLDQLSRLWREDRSKLDGNREQLQTSLQRLSSPQAGEILTNDLALRAARRLAEEFDAVHGGIGGAPKFPQAPVLDLVWQAALATGDRVLRQRILHTLQRISQGGIYDHLGGGYARYSVDAYWLVPHFEKMLYDNAQLLSLLGSAWASTGEPLFRERAAETVDWLQREMMVDGAFASSLDADSEGEEGRFYVWDAAEIDRLLGEDAATFRLAYGVTENGNWEGHNILNRLHEPGLPDPAEAETLARSRTALLAARAQRERPGRDDKVLADWNGLMIGGLAEAAGYFGRPDWRQLAQQAFETVCREMGDGDHLVHSWRQGRRLEMAFVEDYAQMARAALALFGMTGDLTYLAKARAWTARADADFLDPERGAYFQTAAGDDGLIVRPMSAHDGPYPSGNGTMALVNAMLWHLTGEATYRARAEGLLRAFAGEAPRHPFAHATLLRAAAFLESAVQIVVVGEATTPGSGELLAVAAAAPLAAKVLHPLAPGAMLPRSHPAHGKSLVEGQAAAYVCVGTVCELPVTDPAALRERLAAR
ncbi:MAG: thioredoxin domain-containing protein [Geminicoccaceae bacterium]